MSPKGLSTIGPIGLALITEQRWGLQLEDAGRGPRVRCDRLRKEAKTSDTGKLNEGSIDPRDQLVVVEDVIATQGRR